MSMPSTPTTESGHQFNFQRLATQGHNLNDRLSVDDMIGLNKPSNVWGCTSYRLPVPYLRPREMKKDTDESKARKFVQAPGDGAAYKIGKANRGRFYQLNSYGKDGKEPPHSYLPYKEMGVKKAELKKDDKGEKKTLPNRGSFIDDIFTSGKKWAPPYLLSYKYPGPGGYFASGDNKDKEKKKEAEAKDGGGKKKFERLNFLCDAEYIGLNNPCPGTYNMKDTWKMSDDKKKKSEEEQKKQKKYVAGAWKMKNDQGHGPGAYEVTRLLSVVAKEGETKGKGMRRFASIPTFERPKLGIINKDHNAKSLVKGKSDNAAPGTYFKDAGQLEKTYRKIAKPMRKY